MPTTTSISITASTETVKTYFIKTYDNSAVFIKTTKSKIDGLIHLIDTLGVEIEEWGEMSDFGDIYEF